MRNSVDTQGGAVICYARKLPSGSAPPVLSRNVSDLLSLEDEMILWPTAQVFRRTSFHIRIIFTI